MLKHMIEDFKLYHRSLADHIVDFYDNGDDSITVVLDNGCKMLHDNSRKSSRYIPKDGNSLDEHQITVEFKDRLQRRMVNNHITQKMLSEITGIPQCSISMYTSGKRLPTLYSAFKIARALKCSIDDLIYVDPKR